jgi:hypothetical protein
MRYVDGFEYLSASEAARMVGCSSRTILRYCAEGKVRLRGSNEAGGESEIKLRVWQHPGNGYYYVYREDADRLARLFGGRATGRRAQPVHSVSHSKSTRSKSTGNAVAGRLSLPRSQGRSEGQLPRMLDLRIDRVDPFKKRR